MSDSNHDEILSEFTVVTGVSEDRAKFYLESANWNLQVIAIYHMYCFLCTVYKKNCKSHQKNCISQCCFNSVKHSIHNISYYQYYNHTKLIFLLFALYNMNWFVVGFI